MKRLLPTLKGCARMLPSTAMAIAALTAGSVTATAADPGRPKAVDYSAISYEWTDPEGHTHISTLDRKAETYEQIVALLKEIYTNPAVPGFVKDPVGYGADYAEDRNENVEVKYAPCAQAPYDMAPDLVVPVPVEGATALLVELKDDYKYDQNEDKSAEALLKKVKAVSVLTKQMYIGEDVGSKNPGYLFNYVGTLDKFFIITKGSNRVPKGNPEGFAPFFQMFEEFSPSNTGPIYDAFTDMNSGRQFPVDHNCSTIMGQNHIVVMTGENADVDPHAVNFLFYLPDKRFAGYYAHPVVELISPVEPGDGFSLSLVYNNGNTYGNRRVVMEAMPGVSADEDGIFKHGFVDDTNPVDYQYHSAVLWSAVNASVQGTADPDESHIIAGYRVWQTHDSENDYTLIWGLEGDGEDIPAGADTWGVAARGFVSHVATPQNPVTVDHKVRMYSVVPAAMRILREENGAADAVYAVSDASISRTVTSLDNLTTGVDGIETPGGNVEYRYFDLTGREIKASDLSRGVYIRVGAGKSEKIIL